LIRAYYVKPKTLGIRVRYGKYLQLIELSKIDFWLDEKKQALTKLFKNSLFIVR